MSDALSEQQRLAAEALAVAATAFQLIRSPARWVKREWAVDSRGRAVSVYDPQASRFCLVGAVLRAESDRFGAVTDYNDLSAERPMSVPGSPRLRLLLDLLSCRSIGPLRERGFVITIGPATDEGPSPADPAITQIFLHDLPAVLNGAKGVKHEQVLIPLVEAAALLRDDSLIKALIAPASSDRPEGDG